MPPAGSKSAQGHDLEMAINCLGHYLLARPLSPVLAKTWKESSMPDAVRIVWVSSMLEAVTATDGMELEETGAPKILSHQGKNYMQSKVGVAFVARERSEERKDLENMCCRW